MFAQVSVVLSCTEELKLTPCSGCPGSVDTSSFLISLTESCVPVWIGSRLALRTLLCCYKGNISTYRNADEVLNHSLGSVGPQNPNSARDWPDSNLWRQSPFQSWHAMVIWLWNVCLGILLIRIQPDKGLHLLQSAFRIPEGSKSFLQLCRSAWEWKLAKSGFYLLRFFSLCCKSCSAKQLIDIRFGK